MANDFLFTSESVSEGHPDKVADQISDAILDAIFKQDPRSRVAAETLTNTGLVVLAGEITTNAHVDYIQVARDTIKRIGYDNTEYGIDYKGCAVLPASLSREKRGPVSYSSVCVAVRTSTALPWPMSAASNSNRPGSGRAG